LETDQDNLQKGTAISCCTSGGH